MAARSPAIAPERTRRNRPPWVDAIGAQLFAFLVALVFAGLVGAIIIKAYGESPMNAYATIWRFSTRRPEDFARVLESATPLIFSALALSVAFKAGMFNIGVEGQYVVGLASAAIFALGFRTLPGPILLPLTIFGACLGSTIWAAIPAVLKVTTGAHEVVTTIMMNGIAGSLVGWMILHPLHTSDTGLIDLRTDIFPAGALMPTIASTLRRQNQIPDSVRLTWFFPLALVACALVWFLLYRTRLGYEVRGIGSSPGAAQSGGVSVGATQIKIFLISGVLAGFVGLNQLLGDKGFLASNYEAGLGFAGIAVAFLGRNSPIGIPLAAILYSMLLRGQDGIAVTTNLPIEILIILQGVLILSVVIAYELVNRRLAKRQQGAVRAEEAAAETGGSG
jgi:general nucleoside transport system permease protein